MRIAGVRLVGGRVVWLEADDVQLSPLDTVEVLVDHTVHVGTIFVTPEQLLYPPTTIHGRVENVVAASDAGSHCGERVDGAMPPLGTIWGHAPTRGLVVSIDVLKQTVMLRGDDGVETQVVLENVATDGWNPTARFAKGDGGPP